MIVLISIFLYSLKQLYDPRSPTSTSTSSSPRTPCKIVCDVHDIVRLGYNTDKRPNPKNRKKKQLKHQQQQNQQQYPNKSQQQKHTSNDMEKQGEKKKRRF